MNRPYPQAVEVERALLGGLIQAPDQLFRVDVEPEDFYRRDHQAVYRLLRQMRSRDESIDEITVPERVSRSGNADEYGGVPYVLQLTDHVPSTANLPHYARLIRDHARRRRALAVLQEQVDALFDAARPAGEVLELARQAVAEASLREAGDDWIPIDEAAHEAVTAVEERVDTGFVGYPTGIDALDAFFRFQCGRTYMLGGRPGMGKSLCALQLMAAAAETGDTVALFSLEMGAAQWGERAVVRASAVPANSVRFGDVDHTVIGTLRSKAQSMAGLPIVIYPKRRLTWAQIERAVRQLRDQLADTDHPLGLVVIDYVQLIQTTPGVPKHDEYERIAQAMTILAEDADVPLLGLSQLKADCEARKDKRPKPSDLAGSSWWEREADGILLLYRDEVYNPASKAKGVIEVHVAKQRNGPSGVARALFDAGAQSIRNLPEPEDTDEL